MSVVLAALRESMVGQLLDVVLSELYIGEWCQEIVSYVSGDLSEVLQMWVTILKICNVEVRID